MIVRKRGWKFEKEGVFHLDNANRFNYLYFPLTNEYGMISSISPCLMGDAKTDQNSFLLRPITVEDLHTSVDGRNFWVKLPNGHVWSVCGNSAAQKAKIFSRENYCHISVRAGFLWHEITLEDPDIGLKATVTNFIPADQSSVELMEVKITNICNHPIEIIPTAAIPIFGRSADNLRDHRHVTSLLHRIKTTKYGVLVKPTMHFDERGHVKSEISYAILGADNNENPPIGFFPTLEAFIGEGGRLDWPIQIITDNNQLSPPGSEVAGCEALGGLRFNNAKLEPLQSVNFRLVLSISEGNDPCKNERYLLKSNWNQVFQETKSYWETKLQNLKIESKDEVFNQWMKWVTLQPILRRIMGNSFLPYHDYGRGGLGWRDLWQDCSSLIFLEHNDVRTMIKRGFSGVRMDGSNATIIGKEIGEFQADRNKIPRVWMDHGVWPFFTLQLYIHQTGDYQILFEQQPYFRDQHIFRCKKRDYSVTEASPLVHLQEDGDIYTGSILEHILIQNLTSFFNVGEHNIIRLENADWNDGLDMAEHRGESVAFSAFYAYNLASLADLLEEIKNRNGIKDITLAKEIIPLLDTLQNPIDYDSVEQKKKLLQDYFEDSIPKVSGLKYTVTLEEVIKDLQRKSNWMTKHIRNQEWITNKEGLSWFNGYYDDDGNRLEGDHQLGVRITLTGQVFTVLSDIATETQVDSIIKTVDKYLWDEKVQGIRLNTDFHEILLNMGRAFAFAYGHKENGAVFNHMAIMFAYALYDRRKSEYGYRILNGIYNHSINFEESRIYPGIPEYFDKRGRGLYPYLTGSASWYIMTLITKVFGIRGKYGNLIVDPQIRAEQFDQKGEISITTLFDNQKIQFTFHNVNFIEPEDYRVQNLILNNQKVTFEKNKHGIIIRKEELQEFLNHELNHMEVFLDSN